MLSYQHAYHAGNFADVLKHVVLIEVLRYLCQKDKPIRYIDTHAGDGLYPLENSQMQRLQEYRQGIERLWPGLFKQATTQTEAQADSPLSGSLSKPLPEPLLNYLHALRPWNTQPALTCYPGSPALAFSQLRAQDQLQLAELHPKAFKQLDKLARRKFDCVHTAGSQKTPRVLAFQTDGFKHLHASLPPPTGRACTLIDPSYETKSDYETVVEAVKSGHRRFQSGVFLVWYPIVARGTVTELKQRFKRARISNISAIELSITQDTEIHGMTGSGVIVVNGPWNLQARLTDTLDFLCQHLRVSDSGYWQIETLVHEDGTSQ
jgi:23S rRNA (adenine2030-N6)-methyltransferase